MKSCQLAIFAIPKESKIEKTYLMGRQMRAPGGSPAGLDRTWI
jgi:hypothetical protein